MKIDFRFLIVCEGFSIQIFIFQFFLNSDLAAENMKKSKNEITKIIDLNRNRNIEKIDNIDSFDS